MTKKNYRGKLLFVLFFIGTLHVQGQVTISNKPSSQMVEFGNGKLQFTLDYHQKCMVTNLKVNGEPVLSEGLGICSEIRTPEGVFSTRELPSSPQIKVEKNGVTLSEIRYGPVRSPITETWHFSISGSDVKFTVSRVVSAAFQAEEVSFPSIHFNDVHTWDGAFLGYGGIAWFYLFNEKLCTYGVHTGTSSFWNSNSDNGLKILARADGKQVVSKFSRTANDQLNFSISVSDNALTYRYDPDTKRRRFIRGKTDVWDSFTVSAGKYTESVTFSCFDYNKEYDRGILAGIDGRSVSNLLNTIARMGVIDAKLFGGNSWHTPYGPICLHEQYIGQLGIGINDPAYLLGYKDCLAYYRDHAVQPDGRVISRWAYNDEDAMPGKTSPLGFYEAQWGYLLDSNPDFVVNVAETYNQCGDLAWVKSFKSTCENALAYLLKRDSEGNHLVEVFPNSLSEKKSSDWIDIIWASYENAFINAKLYYALTLWAGIEKQLGDQVKYDEYTRYASAMKLSFNKPTTEGGFWSEKNKWYVHWREKDGSVHGDNLVVPVNFMAIAYGLCDNSQRKQAILDRVEDQMQKENLFAWPICLFSYAPGEGNDWQFPFPNYENGDIFLSWGALGVESYAAYKPDLALKYVENILAQYKKDGLAFQRYGRSKQDGLGDDILSGNSLAMVGLYKSIYGLNPLYNRLYLNPHLTGKLFGTKLIYSFRNEKLEIDLDNTQYSISGKRFKISSKTDFGFFTQENTLEYFNRNEDVYSLKAGLTSAGKLAIDVENWDNTEKSWTQNASVAVAYFITGLKAGTIYNILVDGKVYQSASCNPKGILEFKLNAGKVRVSVQS